MPKLPGIKAKKKSLRQLCIISKAKVHKLKYENVIKAGSREVLHRYAYNTRYDLLAIIEAEKREYFAKLKEHPLCKECPGYCCIRMAIVVPLTYSRKIDYERALEESNSDSERYNIEYMRRNFIRLKPYKELQIGVYLEHNGGRERVLFTCRQFDKVHRRCMDYKNRPRICRIFFCHALKSFGEIPKPFEMMAGRILKENYNRLGCSVLADKAGTPRPHGEVNCHVCCSCTEPENEKG